MCKASKYLKQIDEMVKCIEEDIQKLSNKASEYDRQMSVIYHRVEQRNFNAAEGYYIAKELQEVTRKRRIAKNERDKLRSIRQTLNLNNSQIKNANSNLHRLIDKHNTYTENWDIKAIEIEVLH